MMKKKKCFKCGKTKNISEFYKHSKMADGYLNKCKECTKYENIKNRNKNIEYYREYDRNRSNDEKRVRARAEYIKTDKGKEISQKSKKKWIRNNEIKRKAQSKLSNALRDNKIIKEKCCVCGTNKNINAHHEDYSKPLDVIWLCAKHHSEHHKKLREKKRDI